jgi:hypothetical protein
MAVEWLRRQPGAEPLGIGWSGCPAVLACLHYLDPEDEPVRPTALCRACGAAFLRLQALRAQLGERWP